MFMTGTLRSCPVMPDCRSTSGLLEGVFELCSLRVSSLFKDRVTELRTCGASIGVHVFLPTNFCFSLMFFSMLLKPPNQLLRCPSRDKPLPSGRGSWPPWITRAKETIDLFYKTICYWMRIKDNHLLNLSHH